jgi:hypothetical protein
MADEAISICEPPARSYIIIMTISTTACVCLGLPRWLAALGLLVTDSA